MARAGAAHAPLSPLSGTTHVLVDLGPDTRAAAAEQAQLSAWLQAQACPVIGIAAAGEGHALAPFCDAVVRRGEDAAELVANIEAAPIAAMVLVQLLRASEGLEIPRALVCESLAYATVQAGGNSAAGSPGTNERRPPRPPRPVPRCSSSGTVRSCGCG